MLFTSESVTRGHPDKICDQIADYILHLCLEQDPSSHVACEVCCTTGTVILMGEITTDANVDYKKAARIVLEDIGYTDTSFGIDPNCSVIDLIDKQSPEIDYAVQHSYEGRNSIHSYYDAFGAGDQGIMFGYACSETEALMPLSIFLANRLARRLDQLSYGSQILRPDGKTQVTIAYDDSGSITHIDTILISAQHHPGVSKKNLEEFIRSRVVGDVIEECSLGDLVTSETKLTINPSGSFTIGGPHGDTGLTGRKLAVDTYGGHARFGGGAMSGKDPSKVDRSAAYMARYAAKHIVAAGLAAKCEIQVSYGIGMSKPVSINVNTFGTSVMPEGFINNIIKEYFDFRPAKIIETLHLTDTTFVDYYTVSKGCHFGNYDYTWEKLNDETIESLKSAKREYFESYCK